MRNFRLFFTGQLVSQTGTWLTTVAQTLLVLDLTDSGVAIGLLTACQFGPLLALGAWAGAVADRLDKRRMLLVTQAGAMLQSLTLGFVVLAGAHTLGLIYALAVVQGILTAFDNPVRRSLVVEMVDGPDVANAVSLNSAVMTGSRIVGPAVAGGLIVAFGFAWCFLIDGISYIAVLVGLWRIRTEEIHSVVPEPRTRGQVREGMAYIWGERRLRVPMVMLALIGTVAFNFQVTLPLLVSRSLGGDESTFSLLFSALSVGSLVGALATARRTEVTRAQLVTASVAFGVAMLALAASPNLATAFFVAPLLGASSIALMTSVTASVQVLAEPRYRGRVSAIQAMVFLGSTPIGGPLVGALSQGLGARAGVTAGGVACLVAAAYGARALAGPQAPGSDGTGADPAMVESEAITLAD